VGLLGRLRTQWERSPNTGGRMGLPADRLEAMARLVGFEWSEERLGLLQLAELEVIGLDAQRAKQARDELDRSRQKRQR